MKFLFIFFVGTCIFWKETVAMVFAKSDLMVCESTQRNPHNVVDNKSCEKKLIVSLAVASGQKATEALYFTTNKIYDRLENEEARLYNPFIVKISSTRLKLVYPFFYEGTVNNKPYEEIRTKDRCKDGFLEREDRSSCGFALDPLGNKIWDSQGFCCSCSFYEIVPRYFRKLIFGGRNSDYHRGGQEGLCGYAHTNDKNDKFAFCMRYDDLWYDVFSIKPPRLSLVITIQAYDQVEKHANNKTAKEWVDGGKLELNYQKRSGVGKHGRLLGTFLGTFGSLNEIPNLVHKYLLIPKGAKNKSLHGHDQVKGGFKEYMLVPSDMVSLRPSSQSCNMVGVSYSSFRSLGGGSAGRGHGCSQKLNNCFNNQPKDLFEHDKDLVDADKRPQYFVDHYGNCTGVNRDGPSELLGIVYDLDRGMKSVVVLEVSADDMILIYNRASGVIVKSYAKDFNALSKDGKMTVVVQNTGLVTADFYVVFADCSTGVFRNNEKRASINPKATHSFHYEINVYLNKGKSHFCKVELYDSRRSLQDTANVTFKTFTPCICLQHCSCQCNAIKFEKKKKEDKEDDAHIKDCSVPEDEEEEDNEEKEDDFSSVGILRKIVNMVKKILGFRIAVLLLLLFLGLIKAALGRQALTIAKFGFGGVKTGETLTKIVNGVKRTLVYNASMDLVDPQTNDVIIPNNRSWDFWINIFFFILLPILIVISMGKIIKALIKLKQKSSSPQPPLQEPEPQKCSEPETAEKGSTQPRRIRIIPKTAQKPKAAKLITNAKKIKGSAKLKKAKK